MIQSGPDKKKVVSNMHAVFQDWALLSTEHYSSPDYCVYISIYVTERNLVARIVKIQEKKSQEIFTCLTVD